MRNVQYAWRMKRLVLLLTLVFASTSAFGAAKWKPEGGHESGQSPSKREKHQGGDRTRRMGQKNQDTGLFGNKVRNRRDWQPKKFGGKGAVKRGQTGKKGGR